MKKNMPPTSLKARWTLWSLLFALAISSLQAQEMEPLPLFYWQEGKFINFGDHLSLKLVERIVDGPVRVYQKKFPERKLLALGSILSFACESDVIWGTGLNGKRLLKLEDYRFKNLNVKAVRGPITRAFLKEYFQIDCPEVYGDPALLMPYFFPEFKRSANPSYDFIVIPHYSEKALFPEAPWVVYPTDPWDEVVSKILDSKFVISSSLHGIVVAEAYGIPARMLRVTENEAILKYVDYYLGTKRMSFTPATSVEQALEMGGEPPMNCDLEALYQAFPFELWQLNPEPQLVAR